MTAARRKSADGPRAVLSALEEGLSAHLGRPVRAAVTGREPLGTSTHPISRLRVALGPGEEVPVVFKRLRPSPGPKGDRREVLIYRRLLAGGRYGSPQLYASVYDEARGRYWLFLEDVGDESVGSGDLPDWAAAARLLGQLHGTWFDREEELRGLGCLGEHGADYYHGLAATARRHLELAGARDAVAEFDRLMAGYGAVVEHVVGLPRTFVHGDVYTDNFLLQDGGRVRLIDWESAAVGLGAFDLARLLDGWGDDRPMLVDAYWDELTRHGGPPFGREELADALRYGEFLTALLHLGWEEEDCRDPVFVEESLARLEQTWPAGGA